MAVYHLKVSVGSRGGGQSARAKYDYVEREGKYEHDAEELEYSESGNMPAWAQEDPRAYWEAADEHERANGSLFREVLYALPVELDVEQRRELAGSLAEQLTGEQKLPYTMAIHKGEKGETAEPEDKDNPHCHLVISERANDGLERSAEQWFKRANKRNPERGGALKSRTMMRNRDWMEQTRERWQQAANGALERAGRGERIDRRSLADLREDALRRGDLEKAAEYSRLPNVHQGAALRSRRGKDGGHAYRLPARGRLADHTAQLNGALAGERGAMERQIEQKAAQIRAGRQELREIPAQITQARALLAALGQGQQRGGGGQGQKRGSVSLNRDRDDGPER